MNQIMPYINLREIKLKISSFKKLMEKTKFNFYFFLLNGKKIKNFLKTSYSGIKNNFLNSFKFVLITCETQQQHSLSCTIQKGSPDTPTVHIIFVYA